LRATAHSQTVGNKLKKIRMNNKILILLLTLSFSICFSQNQNENVLYVVLNYWQRSGYEQ